MEGKLLEIAEAIVAKARAKGAEVAEALVQESQDLSAKVRLGEPELVEEARSRGAGLRVIIGDKSATTSTSDFTLAGLEALVDGAIELASLSQPDSFAGPPDPAELTQMMPELDLFDPTAIDLDAQAAIDLARRAEAAARGADPRITNSEGGACGRTIGASALVTSGGFRGTHRGTHFSISAEPVADDQNGKKQNASYWDVKRYRKDLEDPEAIGKEAARLTLDKLGAKSVPTAEVTVVFHPDAARGLLSLLLGCVSGGSIYRRASYLCEKEGAAIASPLVTIEDDALLPRGLGSRPYDGEGLASRRTVVVDRGTLSSYLLDCYSARKLGKKSTASAGRGLGGTPSVSASNFILKPGSQAPDAILREVERGLFVTSLMGFGFNPATGDFSRGAEGFWIEKGELKQPVSEVTVSLGFDELWKRIDAVGSDLDLRSRIGAPTIRVSRMTVAGR